MKNSSVSLSSFLVKLLFLFFLCYSKLFSQTPDSIIVRIFETSTREELKEKEFFIGRDTTKPHASGDKIAILEGDQIICKSIEFIDMRVTLFNISKLSEIHLYLNGTRSNENECRFENSLMHVCGRIGSGINSYIIYSHNNEFTISNSDGSYSRYFTKFNLNENTVKLSIKPFRDTIALNDLRKNFKADNRNDLTLIIGHFNGTSIGDNSDITIDVYMDDDGKDNPPMKN
jgi:hypothetical protein